MTASISAFLETEIKSNQYGNQLRISTLIVEDHTILREGLRALLSATPNIDVIGDADNGRDAIRLATTLKPALILMELSLPGMNGVEAIREIKLRDPDIKFIVLTEHKADEYVRVVLQSGASAYLLKDATHSELVMAITSVMQGKIYLSPDVTDSIVVGYLRAPAPRSPMEMLTHRERVVLKLIAEGRQNKNIASYLSISVKTVEKHRSNLMKKLDLHNNADITAFAIERQLVNI